ncbi:hypothetical protein GCM10025859_48030 [Alicyclobacillus fastidiosus]|nr:hypothetical protein GCM10025859_48030 [Alicyclobacillus fastidiosus]
MIAFLVGLFIFTVLFHGETSCYPRVLVSLSKNHVRGSHFLSGPMEQTGSFATGTWRNSGSCDGECTEGVDGNSLDAWVEHRGFGNINKQSSQRQP